MTHSFKFLFSLAMLTAIGFSGCNSGKTDDAETGTTETQVEAPAPAPAPAPATDAGGDTSAAADGTAAPKPEMTPAERIQAQIAEQLKPEKLGPTLEEGIVKVNEAIDKITDEASAQAARPALAEFSNALSMVSSMSGMVPPESAELIHEKVSEAIGPLKEKIDTILEDEAVKKTVGPSIGIIISRLEQLLAKFDPNPPAEEPASEGADVDSEEPAEEPAE